MRTSYLLSGAALFLAVSAEYGNSAATLGRQYGFGFENGNLVPNWSFEQNLDNWYEEDGVTPRLLARTEGKTAVSGSFIAKVDATLNEGSLRQRLWSNPIPVEEVTAYTLSLFVRNSSGSSSNAHPLIRFYADQSLSQDSYLGSVSVGNYPSSADWASYTISFTSPTKAAFATMALVELAATEQGVYYFDDLVMETGSTATSRARIKEALVLTDDAGQEVQTHVKIGGGGANASTRKYLVGASRFDVARRPEKSFAPFVNTGNPDYDQAYETKSQAYNNGSNGKGSLGSRPYSKIEYHDEPGSEAKNGYLPAEAWAEKPTNSGSYYVSDLGVPQTIEKDSSNGQDENERPYRFSWEKDVEGRYSLAWSNEKNQLVQTAQYTGSHWLYKTLQYYPNGNLKKVLTPLDNPSNEAQQEFRQVVNYNSAGEMTSTYTKDGGLNKFWRNKMGLLRFSRHESQPSGVYDFVDYDFLDRPIRSGLQTLANFNPLMAESRASSEGTKNEMQGIIYDDIASFQSRTGFSLSEIIPGKTVGINGNDRVVCEYTFNKEVGLVSLAAKDRFVATFYNYNKYGEVTEVYKYIGAIKTTSRKVHKAVFTYDATHRPVSTSLYDDQGTPELLSKHTFVYDDLGRIEKITGIGERFICKYTYYDWGGLNSITLGGSGTGSSGTRIDYLYNAQGWVKEIKATSLSNGDISFQQFLGYEEKSVNHTNVPSTQAKFDGSIAQQLYKFASDVQSLGAVRLVNYQYDNIGRMTVADSRKNGNASALGTFQNLLPANLAWSDPEDMDTRLGYDDNSRIGWTRFGVSSSEMTSYDYQSGSYKLNKVTGKLSSGSTRDASVEGTFVYDTKGRMIEDKSKKLKINYGWDGMPTEFTVETEDSLITTVNIYDASGQRVARIRSKAAKFNFVPIMLDGITFFVKALKESADLQYMTMSSTSEICVLQAGDRRWEESYADNGSVASTHSESGIFGVAGQIGKRTVSGNYKFYLKNHLGSVMRTVEDNGSYTGGEERAHDYLAYGKKSDLKVGSEGLNQTFTGKEFEEEIGLYGFGARWMDPELGIFVSQDPAGQFSDPYSYTGGNPANLVDPNGMYADNPDDGPHVDWGNVMSSGSDGARGRLFRAFIYGDGGAFRAQIGMPHDAASGPNLSKGGYREGEQLLSEDPSGQRRRRTGGGRDSWLNVPSGTYYWLNFGTPGSGAALNYAVQNGIENTYVDLPIFDNLSGHPDALTTRIYTQKEQMDRNVAVYLAFYFGGEAAAAGMVARSAAIAARSASAAKHAIAGSAKSINPLKGDMNCVDCAAAMDATLAGKPTIAGLSEAKQISVLGKNWAPVTGQAQIERILLDAGKGARGIIYGADPAGEVGHVWNAVNQKSGVNFIDAQSGGAGAKNFQYFTDLLFLRTH